MMMRIWCDVAPQNWLTGHEKLGECSSVRLLKPTLQLATSTKCRFFPCNRPPVEITGLPKLCITSCCAFAPNIAGNSVSLSSTPENSTAPAPDASCCGCFSCCCSLEGAVVVALWMEVAPKWISGGTPVFLTQLLLLGPRHKERMQRHSRQQLCSFPFHFLCWWVHHLELPSVFCDFSSCFGGFVAGGGYHYKQQWCLTKWILCHFLVTSFHLRCS